MANVSRDWDLVERSTRQRLTILMTLLTFAFAGPTSAQPTNAADQNTREQVTAIVTKYVGALNKGDTQAYSDLFAPDGVAINPFGIHKKTGAQFLETLHITHKLGLTLTAKVEDVEPLFDRQGVLAIAPYTGTYTNYPVSPKVSGNLLFVLERVGESWKIRAQSASRLAPAMMK